MKHLDIIESQVSMNEDLEPSYPTFASVHAEESIAKVERMCIGIEEGKSKDASNESLYYCKDSFMAAKLAADGCLSAICTVLDDDCPEQRGFAIIRPPGHHAHGVKYHGFCFFNNVALAA